MLNKMELKKIPESWKKELEKIVGEAKKTSDTFERDELIRQYFHTRGVIENLHYDLEQIKYLDRKIKRLL